MNNLNIQIWISLHPGQGSSRRQPSLFPFGINIEMFSFSDGNILRRAGGHPPLHFHFAINRNVEQGWRGDNGIVHLENSSNSAAITWFLHLGFFRAVKNDITDACSTADMFIHFHLLSSISARHVSCYPAGRNCTISHSALAISIHFHPKLASLLVKRTALWC